MTRPELDVLVRTAHNGKWRAVLWRATAVWLVPFVGTAPLVGDDGAPAVSFVAFKAAAVGLLTLVLLVMRRWPPPGWRLPQTAVT